MANNEENPDTSLKATSDEVKRLLEIGKLLAAVLTPEEIEQINLALNGLISLGMINHKSTEPIQLDR